MAGSGPFYLGFDLSTQQLKGIAVTSDLKVAHQAVFDFDVDASDYGITKGVLINETEHEVFAPIAMWLRAVDVVLQRLHDKGIDFGRVRGISGAGMQHGSVYWDKEAEHALKGLQKDKALEGQLKDAFSYPYSPNWQDASTQKQCDAFDQRLGNEVDLAKITGSKAHHVSLFLFPHHWPHHLIGSGGLPSKRSSAVYLSITGIDLYVSDGRQK